MIFDPSSARLVLAGRKTQARFPVRDGVRRCQYRPGRVYSVQPGWGREAVGRVRVLGVGKQRLGDLDERDAKAEGFDSPGEFLDYWREQHGGVLAEEQLVWAVVFEVADDEPRLLLPAAAGDAAHERGYTARPERAMRGEPEAVDDVELRVFAADARERAGEAASREIREIRDEIAERIKRMQVRLADADASDKRLRRIVRELEQKLQRLDRHLEGV